MKRGFSVWLPALCGLALTGMSINAFANDFPTQARVEYVFECMAEHGGSSYENLYHCSCQVDKLAQQMSYDTFVEAQTFEHGRHAAGERGGILREGALADSLREKLEKAKAASAKTCMLDEQPVARASQSQASSPSK